MTKSTTKDPFADQEVTAWKSQKARAWEQRHMNAEQYYLHHVDPGTMINIGQFNVAEKEQFQERLHEWEERNLVQSSTWGAFSLSIPGRTGVQCRERYKNMVKEGYTSSSNKSSSITTAALPDTELSESWETQETRQLENHIDCIHQQSHGKRYSFSTVVYRGFR
ncbi:hypothetical protein BDB00DRAFT_767898 [Zychaea mexicana]|uniref:uncharacterized protein n=1 Tax=Zychaea mexicana TaxID=64656 RepID=UPI0022FDB40E|nr:uncharacterized protein BDB00DRAFT_767898 [Zychaea mexicana]KAI9490947.1 hypothetical protein BDB00DRAFT_767898 [Zychaea mexicana]